MLRITRSNGKLAAASRHPRTGRAGQPHSADRFPWARNWEFWLAVALAAFLRLWHLDVTQFLDDQAGLMTLARGAFVHAALPVTSISSSIGGYTPPLVEYLLMPFMALSNNPFAGVVSIALWNVLGVALCYIFALRYFGRLVAASAALLFATCGAAVNYSRFLWQPNYLATFMALWAITLYAFCVDGRRRWFVAHVAVFLAAIMMHLVAALLIPISALAILLAPQRPTRRDNLYAGGIVLLLLLPTAVFELVSRAWDLRVYAHLLLRHGTFDLAVVRAVYASLGAPDALGLDAQTLYASYGAWYPVLNAAQALLVAGGYAVLTALVLRPLMRLWQLESPAESWRQRIAAWAVAVWAELRANRQWRSHVLLWLWITEPVVLMLHHSSPVQVHYMLVFFPALFILAGFAVHALAVGLAHMGGALRRETTARHSRGRWQPVRAGVVCALLGLLVVAQAGVSALYPATLAGGRFDALAFYGYPLDEMQSLDAQLGVLQRAMHTHGIFVATPEVARYRAPLDYLIVSEHADRVSFPVNCLLLPAPAAGPVLFVSTLADAPSAAILKELPNASRGADIALAGGPPLATYRVAGALGTMPDETPIGPVTFSDRAGNSLRLEAAALAGPSLLRLRWEVLTSTPAGSMPELYRFQTHTIGDTSAAAPGAPTDCQPTRWQAGETLLTWVAVTPPSSPPAASAPATAHATVAIDVGAVNSAWGTPALGPLHLLDAQVISSPLGKLVPAPAGQPTAGRGASTPGGEYTLPLAQLAHA